MNLFSLLHRAAEVDFGLPFAPDWNAYKTFHEGLVSSCQVGSSANSVWYLGIADLGGSLSWTSCATFGKLPLVSIVLCIFRGQ
jgi:hypothetical protein